MQDGDSPEIFISHSSQDIELAKLLVGLLRAALNVPAKQIRCTSVDGYRLRGGADIDERLRCEILGATVLIGLLSPASADSQYVLFELGARWGAGRPLIPLIAPGFKPDSMRGPITGL